MKLIIAGSREFNFGTELIRHYVHKFDLVPTEIVCGGATGIDNCGKEFGERCGLPVKMFNAEWLKYGKASGPMRNAEMSKYGTHLLLIWNGASKGSASMLLEMQKQNKPVYQVIIKDQIGQA